jgi:hypothetical protein
MKFLFLFLLLFQHQASLYLEQCDIWDFTSHRSVHVYYLVSNPMPDLMGQIYFQQGQSQLADRCPTKFTTAKEAIQAARKMGYQVRP